MPGYWKRPTSRTYAYNLSLGEHYYSPMTAYLSNERGSRGEAPGALTYSERLAKQWLHGRKYDATEIRDNYARARSVARTDAISSMEASLRAQEEDRRRYESSILTEQRTQASAAAAAEAALRQTSLSRAERALSERQARTSNTQECMTTTTEEQYVMKKKIMKDDICKRVADVRMMPWEGQEYVEAQSASARARARIGELEKELEEITRKAIMSSSKALKTAAQLASEAYYEDDYNSRAASTKKSKQVIVESASKIAS